MILWLLAALFTASVAHAQAPPGAGIALAEPAVTATIRVRRDA